MAARRRKKRGGFAVFVTVVILLVLAAGAIASDVLLRRTAETTARQQIEAQGITPSRVTVGGGPMLLQLARHRLDDLIIEVPSTSFGGVAASGAVHAKGVDYDGSLAADEVVLDGRAAVADVLGGARNPLPQVSWGTQDGQVTGSTTIAVLGQEVPVSFGVRLRAADGHVYAAPGNVDLGGLPIDAGLVTALFGSGEVEVPTTWVPAPFAVTEVSVDGADLTFMAVGRGVVLEDVLRQVS